MSELLELNKKLQKFAEERDWIKYQSPKNLSMALAGEVGELLEHFQWLTEHESANLSQEKQHEVALEVADIQIYLLRLSDRLNIDILKSVKDKMQINEKKYPVNKVKGSAKKYTEYQ